MADGDGVVSREAHESRGMMIRCVQKGGDCLLVMIRYCWYGTAPYGRTPLSSVRNMLQ